MIIPSMYICWHFITMRIVIIVRYIVRWLIVIRFSFIAGKHIMDVSCASATGIFDPFTMEWANWALDILKLPRNILPEVVDTAGDFGIIPESVFGAEIPIYCSVSDKVAKYFDIKII